MFPSRPRRGGGAARAHTARGERAPQIYGRKRRVPHPKRTGLSSLLLRADSVSSPVGPAGLAMDTSGTSLLLPDVKGTLSFSTKTLTGKTVFPHRRPTGAVRCRQRKAPRGEGLPPPRRSAARGPISEQGRVARKRNVTFTDPLTKLRPESRAPEQARPPAAADGSGRPRNGLRRSKNMVAVPRAGTHRSAKPELTSYSSSWHHHPQKGVHRPSDPVGPSIRKLRPTRPDRMVS